MKRTQIQLPEKEHEELRMAAARMKRSMAHCIREGIRLFLERFRSSGVDLDQVAGKFHPLPLKDLKPHDRWIAEGILGSKKAARRK